MYDERIEAIYYQYHLLVKSVAYSILKDADLVQDVCQDVFLCMTTKALDKLNTKDDLIRFLLTVAKYKAVDYKRKRIRRREVPYPENGKALLFGIHVDHVEKTMDQRDFQTELFTNLRRYRADWYTILIGTEVYNMPAEQLARELGISVGSVRSKLCRAKKWIVKHYGDRYQEVK